MARCVVMLQLVVLISLMGAPRAPADAPVVGLVPNLSQATTLVPFFAHAGTRSVLLRPEGWSSDAHPLLELDVTHGDAVTAAGIDVQGPLTRGQVGDATMGCVRVSNLDAYRKASDARLARLGTVFEKVEAGVPVYASRDPIGRVLAAYTVSGKDSCAVNGHGRSVEPLFPQLAKATSKPPTGAGWAMTAKVPGALQLVLPAGAPSGVVALNAKEFVLDVDARLKSAPFAQFAGAGPSVLGAFHAQGMAVFRGRVAKAQVPALVEQVARFLPNGAVLAPVAREVAPYVTGNTALLLSHVKVSNGLRTREARLFALKFALLAEVTDAAAVKGVLDALGMGPLTFREGTLSVDLVQGLLVVSNDADAKSKAVAALATASGKQAHGLEFEVDPRAVAKGLQQVPLMEAVQAPELAALVAASTEVGPLLQASTRVTGWLDSTADGQHLGKLQWVLDEAKFQPDAGAP